MELDVVNELVEAAEVVSNAPIVSVTVVVPTTLTLDAQTVAVEVQVVMELETTTVTVTGPSNNAEIGAESGVVTG